MMDPNGSAGSQHREYDGENWSTDAREARLATRKGGSLSYSYCGFPLALSIAEKRE
jgi:hypothetical protein